MQMSEAFITSVFLALSGGFQDAYTYFTRDGVFSNAQTGNVVLMSQHFMMGEWSEGLRYLFPLLAFAVGVFVAERNLTVRNFWHQKLATFISICHSRLPTIQTGISQSAPCSTSKHTAMIIL